MQISSPSSAPLFANDALKDMWTAKTAQKTQREQAAPSSQTVSAQATLPAVGDVAVQMPGEASAPAITTVGSLATASITRASSSSVGDVMNAYMSGQPKGEDKYIRAQEMAASTLNNMRTAQNSILAAGMMGVQVSSGSYADLALAGKQAAANMERQKGKATLDQSQENLDEISEDVEDRAEAAVNPEEGDAASTESTENAEGSGSTKKTGGEKTDADKVDAANEAKGVGEAGEATGNVAGGITTDAVTGEIASTAPTALAENLTSESASQPQQAAPTLPSVDIIV